MNYGEEIAYWYLRLNGFFPIPNFVVHRTPQVVHSTEIDIIATRPEHVFEEIGGQPDDWDPELAGLVDFNRPLGVVCEIKTGNYQAENLFCEPSLQYAVGRLGLVPAEEIDNVTRSLNDRALFEYGERVGIFKLLVSNDHDLSDRYYSKPLSDLERFIEGRVRKYPQEKYGDRMFFSSELFQHTIHRIHQELDRKA